MVTRETGVCTFILVLLCITTASAQNSGTMKPTAPDYLKIVRGYVDYLLENGRDTYGEKTSPLIATTLNLKTSELFEDKKDLPGIPGIRGGDRTWSGSNPMHDEGLYQIMIALTAVTGEKRYEEECDKILTFFFKNCQSGRTNLMAWGEHICWDFRKEFGMGVHEFYRPWVLWERCFKSAPEACKKFALGVWNHQIYDQKTGRFSRHAIYGYHKPKPGHEFPRHGGFYIATWAAAYNHTKDPVFLTAIEVLVDAFEKARKTSSAGAIPFTLGEKQCWPLSSLSLAIDLGDSARKVPEPLAKKMLASARRTDEVILKVNPDGRYYATSFDKNNPYRSTKGRKVTRAFSTGYGKLTTAQTAMLCYLRFQQVKTEGYKKRVLDSANVYLAKEPYPKNDPGDLTLYPGAIGDVIEVLLAAHGLSDDKKYLARADYFAQLAVLTFFSRNQRHDADSPLPRATSKHDHYEAITRADTLMKALLKLWIAQNKPELRVDLTYFDR